MRGLTSLEKRVALSLAVLLTWPVLWLSAVVNASSGHVDPPTTPEPKSTLGMAATSMPAARLIFKATMTRCLHECYVTLMARIEGPIQWCPTSLTWTYDTGEFSGEKASHEQEIECTERVWSALRRYGPGRHVATFTVKSGEESISTKALEILVGDEPAIVTPRGREMPTPQDQHGKPEAWLPSIWDFHYGATVTARGL